VNSVRIYYFKLNPEDDALKLSDLLLEQWLAELSAQKRSSILRLLNRKDRVASLLGLRLLNVCVRDEGINDFCLRELQYPELAKPYWAGKNSAFDFNISHSGNLIIVVVSKQLKVGIDIEKIRKLKSLKFKRIFSTEELSDIEETPGLFFDLWSKKEAVVKAANTAGLAYMRMVKINEDKAELDETPWYLKSINMGDNKYAAHLASSEPVAELNIKQVFLDDL